LRRGGGRSPRSTNLLHSFLVLITDLSEGRSYGLICQCCANREMRRRSSDRVYVWYRWNCCLKIGWRAVHWRVMSWRVKSGRWGSSLSIGRSPGRGWRGHLATLPQNFVQKIARRSLGSVRCCINYKSKTIVKCHCSGR
jgi:hypothetical protein